MWNSEPVGTELGRFDFHKHCTLDTIHVNSVVASFTNPAARLYRLLLWRGVMVYSLFLPCAQVLMYSSIAVHVSLHKPELLM